MDPHYYSNDELIEAFETAKKEFIQGSKIKSWTTSVTSVTKEFVSSDSASASWRVNALAREICYRIGEGSIDASDFPQLKAMTRPAPERIRSGVFPYNPNR